MEIINKSNVGHVPDLMAFLKLESAVVFCRTKFLCVRSKIEITAIAKTNDAVNNPRKTEKDNG
jgi:hypothetical protein